MSEVYKGRVIDSRAFELRDGSGWTAEVYVAEYIGGNILDTPFFLTDVFPTAEAALEAAVVTGRREIDKGIRHSEIPAIIEAETRLPSTHRRGFGHETDDVAMGPNEQPTKVWGPDNPEDLYS